jgi:hypothetical protein
MATTTRINDSTLTIDVANSGAGNIQKWIKEGTVGSIEGTITLDCNTFNTPQTLVDGPNEIDYFVNCVIDVTAALEIEPGVVIAFGENAGIGVYDAGSLKAVGTDAKPILLKGSTALKGWWRGIHIESNSLSNQLDQVTIEDAGSNYVYCCNEAASLMQKDGKVSLKNLTIKNGGAYGLIVKPAAELVDYEAITITGQDEYPLMIAANRLSAITGINCDYTGNTKDFAEVTGDVNTSTVIGKLNIPYLFPGTVVDVTAPLTIEAGTEIVMKADGGIGVYDNGTLNIDGNASAPVIIRGEQALPGYWRGIHLETNSLNNSLRYAEISDAGSNYVYCCVDPATLYFKDGRCKVEYVTLRNGASYGIYASNAFSFPTFSNNVITTHEDAPMALSIERTGELDGLESDFSGNDKDYLSVYNSDLNEEITLPETNVPYQVQTNQVLDIKARLNLEPGVTMKFEENAGLGVYDNGVLNAVGTPTQLITLQGVNEVQGFWRGIHTETNSNFNEISYARLLHAGSNYVYCCNVAAGLYVKSGLMKVTNTEIRDSGGCGISVNPNATLTESDNTFSNNADGNVCN